MTAHRRAAPGVPRLNPFAFPSDTSFRFALLVVSVLGASLFIYNLLYLHIPGRSEALRDAARCMSTVDARVYTHTFKSVGALAAAMQQCTAAYHLQTGLWLVGCVALLMGVAGAIYWRAPRRRMRQERLVPLGIEDVPEVSAYLAGLCREAELPYPPTFVWNPLDPVGAALAFGRRGRYYVRLTGGLVTRFYSDRPAFRAIVLHELAHLRNGDVDRTYMAVAIWRAFVAVALVPYAVDSAVTLLWPHVRFDWNAWSWVLNVSWRILCMAALVYVTRNAVLRAREIYADVRASAWDGPTGGLRRMLEALPPARGPRWSTMVAVHPDPWARRHAVDDPQALFRLGFWDAFGVGVAATIAFSGVDSVLYDFMAPLGDPTLPSIATALLYATLTAGVVGSGLWRATFAALARGERVRGIGRIWLGLGAGLTLGPLLSLDGAVSAGTASAAGDATHLGFMIAWAALILASLYPLLRWIVAGALSWLTSATGSRSPRPACVAGLIAASAMFVVWYGLLFSARQLPVEPGTSANGAPMLALSVGMGEVLGRVRDELLLYTNSLIPAVLVGLWAFPLATSLWRRRRTSVAESGLAWAFLDAASGPEVFPRYAPARLRPALVAGLLGGVACSGLLLLLQVWWHLGAPRAGYSDAAKFMFYAAMLAVCALTQAGAAVTIAVRTRRMRVLQALFAACVAACIGAAVLLGLNLAFGGRVDLPFAWQTVSLAIDAGALLAVPAALGASAVAGWTGRTTPRSVVEAEGVPAVG